MNSLITTPTLSGLNVALLPLQTTHAQGLFDAGCDPSIWQWLGRAEFVSIEDVQQWISESLGQANHSVFVIVEATSQKIIGTTRFLDIQPENLSLEIGYTWLEKNSWGTGINTECKLLLLQHAFETLKYNRVSLKTDERNLRSQRAINKLGATKEGVLRSHMIVRDGHVRNSVLYSITRDEWPKIKKMLTNSNNS